MLGTASGRSGRRWSLKVGGGSGEGGRIEVVRAWQGLGQVAWSH